MDAATQESAAAPGMLGRSLDSAAAGAISFRAIRSPNPHSRTILWMGIQTVHERTITWRTSRNIWSTLSSCSRSSPWRFVPHVRGFCTSHDGSGHVPNSESQSSIIIANGNSTSMARAGWPRRLVLWLSHVNK